MDNSLAINTLLLKAGNRIKSCFENKSKMISFFSEVAGIAYDFQRSFNFVGKNPDTDIDIHFEMLNIMQEIQAAWDADDLILAKAVSEILTYGGPEHFYHTIWRAMALNAWNNTAFSLSPMHITEVMEQFRALFDVAIILEDVQELKDQARKEAA